MALVISEQLRAVFNNSGLSQRKIADKLCVSESTISRWLSGQRKPREICLLSVRKLFNLDKNYNTKPECYSDGSERRSNGLIEAKK